jgi:transcriptional regulator with XRE-family HTH domain|tara:strand:- start:638 stop:994 length:357 start_codon:yes stop_codon:yes gene_type:complete
MSDVKFDTEGFFAALERERARKDLPWRKVAEKAGVSASTMTRLSQGKRPDVDSLASLCAWAKLSADDFMRGPEDHEVRHTSPVAQASVFFRADPNLGDVQADALLKIIESAYEGLRSQ